VAIKQQHLHLQNWDLHYSIQQIKPAFIVDVIQLQSGILEVTIVIIQKLGHLTELSVV